MRCGLAWLVYTIGDAISHLDHVTGDWFSFYPIFNRLLLWADDIQGEGPGPWSREPGDR